MKDDEFYSSMILAMEDLNDVTRIFANMLTFIKNKGLLRDFIKYMYKVEGEND